MEPGAVILRRFEKGTTKFCEFGADGCTVIKRSGNMGEQGRETKKVHPTEAEAQAALADIEKKLIKESYRDIHLERASRAAATFFSDHFKQGPFAGQLRYSKMEFLGELSRLAVWFKVPKGEGKNAELLAGANAALEAWKRLPPAFDNMRRPDSLEILIDSY